ncbi:hypothetical protein HNP12_001916 [Aeromonas hydrophila]|nr:hypothetical protein [Aeromonas hydrophila]MCS3791884.1 hypothetical protein [Aeromonas hydrophila]QGZ74793.1 hypothetical protein GQR50_20875 [Aeromonas hydrophila]
MSAFAMSTAKASKSELLSGIEYLSAYETVLGEDA